jgi:8-oxo-dGTP diphosphatase
LLESKGHCEERVETSQTYEITTLGLRNPLDDKNMKAKPNLSVYLILEKDGEILLGLRHNTGYEDGKYALVAGHAEENEPATYSMCREAKEEIGIDILPEDLEIVHIMHRTSNRENIDIFMHPKKWSGKIQNMEPDKCLELKFFHKDKLPGNMVKYHIQALKNIEKKLFYMEYGWEK